MKKIICLISLVVVSILLTGCGNNKNVVLSCKSEVHGENPTITSYEIYTIEDNKVKNMESYNIMDYEDSYLKNVTIEDIIKIYSKDSSYEVVKVDNNTIKNIKKNPINVFENVKSDDMVEFIRGTMEENEFRLFDYTCEINK